MKPITWNARLWKETAEQFHEFMRPLIAGLGRSERRVAAARYVEGLLMPGHRKSIGRMPEAHWKRFGWWWAGRRVIAHPIAITWPIFIGP